jgi:hypothetical protein
MFHKGPNIGITKLGPRPEVQNIKMDTFSSPLLPVNVSITIAKNLQAIAGKNPML